MSKLNMYVSYSISVTVELYIHVSVYMSTCVCFWVNLTHVCLLRLLI